MTIDLKDRRHGRDDHFEPTAQNIVDINTLVSDDAVKHSVLHGPHIGLVPFIGSEDKGRDPVGIYRNS